MSNQITLYTIGFTQKSAEHFFGLIRDVRASTLIDTRINNKSQLSGFAKGADLPFFLRELCGTSYRHELLLAPTQELLRAYRKKQIDWTEYEEQYLMLLQQRKVDKILDKSTFHNGVLLCSEAEPVKCHRRLAATFLANAWKNVSVTHLT